MSDLGALELQRVDANGVDFAYYEQGDGPLALCLHGYPDSPHTWRYLLPALADAGYRAVAPFQRGYAPTALAPDDRYQSGVLGADANALHQALGGDDAAVLIGHDWGALGAYAAAGVEPERWRRVVTIAVPPGPVTAEAFFSYEQLRLSWYMFFQLHPLAEAVLEMNDHDFIKKLWRDWSPGYEGSADAQRFIDAMPTTANLTAALSYYRQTLRFELHSDDLAAYQGATLSVPDVPLLYLHGVTDGCMSPDTAAGAGAHISRADSRAVMVEGGGHFLQLEQPERVNSLILEFLAET